jgi:hypothetical protein
MGQEKKNLFCFLFDPFYFKETLLPHKVFLKHRRSGALKKV